MNLEDAPLTAAERASADKFVAKHTCPKPDYDIVSAVSGYGYRLKIFCNTCGAREDITEVAVHDPAPPR